MAKGKVIISCAVTGAIHTPSMSPHLPITADEIADAAVGAAEAGAAIIHLHARNPEDGRPDQNPDLYEPFLKVIKQRSDAVLNITTGGHPSMALEERLRPATRFAPEVASLNMGSMGFGLFPMLDRYKDWKHDWEPATLEASRDLVFKNTPRDIAFILNVLGRERAARFEFECYDLSHLYMLKHFADRGAVSPPYFIQFVFGVLGGMGPDPETLDHLIRIADKLFGDDYMFSVLAAGRNQIPMATRSAELGGHVRVGLEDNLTIARGQLARSNAEQVEKIQTIVKSIGRSTATPEDARAMLGLKGADKVNV